MDLDASMLEARWFALSREAHPDHHAQADPAVQLDAMERSAAINDAFHAIREPWSRARLLCERLEPGVLEASARLSPAFLADAMELAEQVALAEATAWPALTEEIERALRDYLPRVRDSLARNDARTAARLLQEARYWQKARSDLRQRNHA